MKTVVVAAGIAAVAVARPTVSITEASSLISDLIEGSGPAVHTELVNSINSQKSTWTAEVNKFASWSLKDVKKLMGVLPKTSSSMVLPVKKHEPIALPDSFDGRDMWGTQCPSLFNVRDQGGCGSCWAVSSAEAQTDRYCIAFNATKGNPLLSAEELTSCCNGLKCFGCSGCNGGQLAPSWDFSRKYGLVTGGLYGDDSTCQPYTIAPCEHHVNGTRPPCTETGSTPKCSNVCFGNKASFKDDRRFFQSPYTLGTVADMQADIFKHGSIQVAFTVYQDFLAYKSGVYTHQSGPALGGHAVKIIGWGTENGTPFWQVVNSWNTDWGNQGYFRIARGTDECGIEDDATAGLPKQ